MTAKKFAMSTEIVPAIPIDALAATATLFPV